MSSLSNAAANGLAQANKPEKKRNAFPDRLIADPQALDRLRAFVDLTVAHFEGAIKPTRSDVANAIFAHHVETLTTEELSFLWKRCFNPVRFLKSTATQVQMAQARGESVTFDQVIERIRKSVADTDSAAANLSPETPEKRTVSRAKGRHESIGNR